MAHPHKPVASSAEVQPLLSFLQPRGSLSPLRIFLSLLILLIFLLVAWFTPSSSQRKKGPKGGRTILLTGPMASGKTSLFSKMLYGSAPTTHTSMKENEGIVKARWSAPSTEPESEVKSESKSETSTTTTTSQLLATPLHLVDTPGHPRLRTRAMAHFLPAADGVVFCVDGKDGLGGKGVREAGEHLHLLLSLLSLLPRSSSSGKSSSIPLLILLTKSDLLSTPSSSSTPSTPTPTPAPTPTNKSKSTPSSSSSSPVDLTLERAKLSLSREMERRRLVSSGSSSARRSGAGAKLEGLEAIPASSASSSPFTALLVNMGLRQPLTTVVSESAEGLPSDEAEVLERGEDAVWGFEGAFGWDKVAESARVEINWAVGSARGSGGQQKDQGVWEWIERI